jgi:hypothetical protein
MKGNATMKKIFLFLSLFIVVTLACDLAVTVAPPTSPAPLSTNTVVPATAVSTQIPASVTSSPATQAATEIPATAALIPTTEAPTAGTTATFGSLTLVVPPGVASGVSGGEYPRVDGSDAPWWQKTPGHLQVMLGDYYVLQGKSRQPQIYVYPALDYAELVPAAFESIHRLDNILYGPVAPISADQLPTVPFFNEAQLFASNIQVISFQNGQGVRFVTEYAQYAASANNNDLFYQFQGVTRDGAYYIIAILPITVPVMAETSDAGAPLPPGGVPYPYMANPNADMKGYYTTVAALLNGASSQAFTPSLDQLDSLIQSMWITP